MNSLEVFADVACPFAHAGLARFVAFRCERGLAGPVLRVRAWPLELVNASVFDGASLVPKFVRCGTGSQPIDLEASTLKGSPRRHCQRWSPKPPRIEPASRSERPSAWTSARRCSTQARTCPALTSCADCVPSGMSQIRPPPTKRRCMPTSPTASGVALKGHRTSSPRTATSSAVPRIEHDESGYDVTFDTVGFEEFIAAVFA